MKYILCLDMDCFFVSVERVLNPTLLGRSVIVGGDPKSRGVVSACSYETRAFGVKSGMALAEAARRCPEALFLPLNFQAYEDYSEKVLLILRQFVPVIEPASIDEFYLDLSGCEDLYGNIFDFVWKLKQKITKILGLPLTIGMAANKHVAKVACNLAKPGGVIWVLPEAEQAFLAPLPVDFLMGVGPKVKEMLALRGINKVETLAALNPLDVAKIWGKGGYDLWTKAQGQGEAQFAPRPAPKSMGAERTFAEDSCDLNFFYGLFKRLVEKLGFNLREQSFETGLVKVKIRYSDFKTVSAQKKIPTTLDERILFATAWLLFLKLYQRRVRLRLVGVNFGALMRTNTQKLFVAERKIENLYAAIDRVKRKHGIKMLNWAA